MSEYNKNQLNVNAIVDGGGGFKEEAMKFAKQQHDSMAKKMGVPDEQINAVGNNSSSNGGNNESAGPLQKPTSALILQTLNKISDKMCDNMENNAQQLSNNILSMLIDISAWD